MKPPNIGCPAPSRGAGKDTQDIVSLTPLDRSVNPAPEDRVEQSRRRFFGLLLGLVQSIRAELAEGREGWRR
jgi:hypothetical protein